MGSRFLRKCPCCGTLIGPDQVPPGQSKGFPCPVCGECLRSSLHNLTRVWAISLLGSAAVSYAFALRGWTFLVVALFGSLPISFLVYAAVSFVFPPPLERSPKKEDGGTD